MKIVYQRFTATIRSHSQPLLNLFCLGLCAIVGVSSPSLAKPAQGQFPTFSEWCTRLSQVSTAQRHTIEVLLQQAKTQDCQQAEQILSSQPSLSLGQQQLSDLSPLASLTHLKHLNLIGNQITDLRPLAALNQLTFLLLTDNQITDVSPLASLNQLTYLVLERNQITDIQALAPLTQLTALTMLNNPLVAQRCPVRPATICIFDDDGQTLVAQAEDQVQQGALIAARKTFEQALDLYRTAQDDLRRGNVLNRLGDLALQTGRYAEALNWFEQAANLRRGLGDLPGTGTSLTSLATAYEQLGQYAKAAETLQQAEANFDQQWRQGIPLEGGLYELPKDAGALQRNLAVLQNRLGQHYQALVSLRKGLKLYKLLPDGYRGKRGGEQTILDTMGLTYASLVNPKKATSLFQEALKLAQERGDRAGEGTILTHLGEVALGQGQRSLALSYFQSALALHQAVGNKPGEGETLNHIGTIRLQQQQWSAATDTLLAAIQVWESLRPGLTDEHKVALFETQLETYRQLQQALIARKRPEEALETAERSRARALVELLASRLQGQASDRFQSAKPPTVAEIREIAKTQKATLVEYSILGDQLLIWVIDPKGVITLRTVDLEPLDIDLSTVSRGARLSAETGGSLSTRDLPVSEVLLRQAKKKQQRSPLRKTPSPSQGTTDASVTRLIDPYLLQTYQLLIDPIADLLPSDPQARVIFIPQNSLLLVPFAALQQQGGTYLIEHHTILTAPAIQALDLTHQQRQQLATSPSNTGELLVVGNPQMPSLAFDIGATPIPLEALPGSEQEAEAIAELLQTQALTGGKATEATVVDRMQRSRIVHLATHGLLDEIRHLGLGVPGAIALTPSPLPIQDDGLLTASEIFDLDLRAELVVLSACNTGRGDITGDGIVGLSRSLIAAGVPSVVVSLWAVPDQSTSELMIEFYQQLQQQSDKAQALRQAMLTTLQRYPRPQNWAAFTLIGEAE